MTNLEALKRVNIPTKWKLLDFFFFTDGCARLPAEQSALSLQVVVDTEPVQRTKRSSMCVRLVVTVADSLFACVMQSTSTVTEIS